MKQSFFNLLLGVLAMITLVIPFTGKVHDGRHARSNFFKGFTKRGWFLLIVILIGVLITYLKDKQIENDDIKREKSVEANKRKDDSLADIRLDVSNAKIVSAFTSSLAKYGLKYDSTQKLIQRIVRDSSKKEITTNVGHPEVYIDTIILRQLTNDTLKVAITFANQKDEARDILIPYWVIIDDGTNQYPLPAFDLYFRAARLNSSKTIRTFFTLNHFSQLHSKNIFFYFKGAFYNHEAVKFPFEYLCVVNSTIKGVALPTDELYKNTIGNFRKYFPDSR